MKKILVVDDDQTIRDLFRRSLKNEGYEVLVAKNGEECLSTFEKEEPNTIKVVFLDLRMEGIAGENTFERIKEINKDIPVVIITGYGTYPEKLRLFRKKVDRYISKPFDMEFIKMFIRNKINWGINKKDG
jgi:DNA-binding NtrC family response regulator